jgi:hypothetical protein
MTKQGIDLRKVEGKSQCNRNNSLLAGEEGDSKAVRVKNLRRGLMRLSTGRCDGEDRVEK